MENLGAKIMTQDTNVQIAASHVIAKNRARTTFQAIMVMSVCLIATTLIGVTSLATIGV